MEKLVSRQNESVLHLLCLYQLVNSHTSSEFKQLTESTFFGSIYCVYVLINTPKILPETFVICSHSSAWKVKN